MCVRVCVCVCECVCVCVCVCLCVCVCAARGINRGNNGVLFHFDNFLARCAVDRVRRNIEKRFASLENSLKIKW